MATLDGRCTNCAMKFISASQIFTNITIVDEMTSLESKDITILNAISQIFRFSATDLARAHLNNDDEIDASSLFNEISETGEYIMKYGLSMCGNCISVFKEVYLVHLQLKKLSTEAALLTKAIKKYSSSSVKFGMEKPRSCTIETDKTEVNTSKTTKNSTNSAEKCTCSSELEKERNITIGTEKKESNGSITVPTKNTTRSRKIPPGTRKIDSTPEREDVYSEDYFQDFDFEQNEDYNEEEEEDMKIDVSQYDEEQEVKVDPIQYDEDYYDFEQDVKIEAGEYDEEQDVKVDLSQYTKTVIEVAEVSPTFPLVKPVNDSYVEHSTDRRRLRKDDLNSKSKTKKRGSENLTISGRKATLKRPYNKKKRKSSKRGRPRKSDLSSPSNYLEDENKTLRSRLKSIVSISPKQKQPEITDRKNSLNFETIAKQIAVSTNRIAILRSAVLPQDSSRNEPTNQYSNGCEIQASFKIKIQGTKEHNDGNNRNQNSQPSSDSKVQPKGNEKLAKCSCGQFFNNLGSLRRHEANSHKSEESLMCDTCGEIFSSNYLLYRHISLEHFLMDEIIFKCQQCDGRFLNNFLLKRHIEEHHSECPGSFMCEKCGRSYNSVKSLKKHSLIHKDEDKDIEFKCPECSLILKHEKSLKRHISIMHKNVKTFSCPQCGKTTKNMTNMRIHMTVHDPNRLLKRKPPNKAQENIQS